MSTPAGRRPGIGLRWVLMALVLLPLLEIVVLVAVGQRIGFWWTFLLVVGVGALGAWLARREGGRTWRALQHALQAGSLPADEITDTLLVSLGGLLLLLPGFVSDLLGLVLVLPFSRPFARRLLQGTVASATLGSLGHPGQVRTPRMPRRPGGGDVIEGEIVSETPPPSHGGEDQQPPALGR